MLKLSGSMHKNLLSWTKPLGQLLANLVEQHPQLGKQLYNEQGQLRSFVNIYVGDEDIRYLQGVETPVPDGETVSIIPAIAGGC